MRRKDKEIVDINNKISIIQKCKVCRLGLSENNKPYIIPLNYGYSFENDTLVLFFHSATEGRKIKIAKTNNQACFEMDCDIKIIESENPCNFGYAFKSIIFGRHWNAKAIKKVAIEKYAKQKGGMICGKDY